MMLLGAGQAWARPSAAHAPGLIAGPVAPGTITTIAGGVGGPGPATRVSLRPCAMTSSGGDLYVADNVNQNGYLSATIRAISGRTGWLTTPAGNGVAEAVVPPGTPARAAALAGTCGLAFDRWGDLITTSDASGFPLAQVIDVVPAATGRRYGQAMHAGDIYPIAGVPIVGGPLGDGGPATKAVLTAGALAIDASGNIIEADIGHYRIRVIAAVSGTFYGIAMTAGDIYTVAGDGMPGFSGDRGPAVRAHIFMGGTIQIPRAGLAVDAAGNILFADSRNNRVRVVAGQTGRFYGLAMTEGDIYTVAGSGAWVYGGDGGPARQAGLFAPAGLAVDRDGNVVVADSGHHRVRVVAVRTGRFYGLAMRAGDIYTVAGNGRNRDAGDGGPARRAALQTPSAISLDAAGNVVIGD
ncbi:MAG TPA: hypothetical protein VF834_24275, partial [Streptosporangiaceae bacterium]